MKTARTRGAVILFLFTISVIILTGCTGDKNTYITSYTAPGVPANIQAVAGDGEVTVRWSPVAGATSYNIYWNTTGSVTTSDEALISTPSPYVHAGLINGTTYYYVVTAVNIEGESTVSDEVSATPVDSTTSNPPSAPTGVLATAGDGQVTISWSAVSGAITYNIYWNTTGSVTASDSAIISAPSPYVHTSLANGTTYSYAVTAINNDGESGLSTEVSATPQAAQTPPGTPPSAPTGVLATAGDGQVTVSWSPVTGAMSYNIYWNTTGGVTASDSAIISAPSPYVHLDLTNDTTSYYAVTAVNSDGESALSTEASATPVTSVSPPAAPTGVMAMRGEGEITISWSPVAGAVSYNIYWNTTGGVTTSDSAIISAPSPYVHQNLQGNDTFYYAVTALNAYGESPLSAEVSAIPRLFSGTSQKIVAFDRGGLDFFGFSVSISGDYAIAGAYAKDAGANDAGEAYIFHRTGLDTWDAGIGIVAPDAQANDRFGWSVSIDGDYAIVGAYYEDGGAGDPHPQAGAAYIFHRTGADTWDTGTKIVAPDIADTDYFGISVAISGDYAIVGADLEDDGGTNAGAAYIFRRTGTNTWDTGTKILATDPQADDLFGYSVSISGDYAVVGAFQEDAGGTDAGAAYIYRRTGTNTWDTGTKIVAPDAQAGDKFGTSVSISGEYAIVGANAENEGGTLAGAAYIFRWIGTNTWDAGTKIVAPDAQPLDDFGISVSISGDLAVVGADGEDEGASNAGAAYIFRRTGPNTWDPGTKIIAPDPGTDGAFGWSVCVSGDSAIVGAYYNDSGLGASYIY